MAQEKMTLEDWLDDLCVRFIINLPRADLSSVARICFQIEEAQWFYEDFIRPLDPALPSMSLRTFSLKMFQHCPLLASFSADSHLKAFDEFMQYKTRVPVRGAVMLNDAMDAAVLVRGYKKGASWSFPRGKINKDEDDVDCAIREVYEETGYDLRATGLAERNAPVHPLEVTMHDQQVRLYVFRGIPEDTIFETRTRKEIGDIKWYKLSDLPTYKKKKGSGKNQGSVASTQERFYMVAPFMLQLRQWVLKQKDADAHNISSGHRHPPVLYDDVLTDENVLHEPPPPTSSNIHSDDIDSTTRELHRLLKIKPPTQGLQIPPTTSVHQAGQAGQALLSILQPKSANTGYVPGQGQSRAQLYGFSNDGSTNSHQTPTMHNHHFGELPVSGATVPSLLPTDSTTSLGSTYRPDYAQHRPRPQVFITDLVPPPAHEAETPPVQLLHPQPLPPQVQKEMLLRELRDSAASPNVAGIAHHPVTGITQAFQPVPPNAQHHPYSHRDSDAYTKQPPQYTAHSTNLLNVLKGKHPPVSVSQQSTSRASPSTGSMLGQTDHRHWDQRVPTSEASLHNLTGQLGASTISSGNFPSATIHGPAPFSRDNNRPIAPTDHHRASLLGMFKTGQSSISQSQFDGQGGSYSPAGPRASKTDSPGQQRASHSSSAADVLKTMARDHGQPAQWNPEVHLPYGAHSILRRSDSLGSNRSPPLSARNSNEAAARLPVQSHPSPASSRGHMSPRRQMSPRGQMPARGHMSPYQSYLNAKLHSPKQAVAQAQVHATTSYPYGGSHGSALNPLTQSQGTPPVHTGSAAGVIKPPLQGSSAEHRNTLLSMFGTSQPESSQGKGKESAEFKHTGNSPGPVPRSRGSLASQGSGQGSSALLSSADRNFLLGFLENKSSHSKPK